MFWSRKQLFKDALGIRIKWSFIFCVFQYYCVSEKLLSTYFLWSKTNWILLTPQAKVLFRVDTKTLHPDRVGIQKNNVVLSLCSECRNPSLMVSKVLWLMDISIFMFQMRYERGGSPAIVKKVCFTNCPLWYFTSLPEKVC